MKRFLLLLTVFLVQVHYGAGCPCEMIAIDNDNVDSLEETYPSFYNLHSYDLKYPSIMGCDSFNLTCPPGTFFYVAHKNSIPAMGGSDGQLTTEAECDADTGVWTFKLNGILIEFISGEHTVYVTCMGDLKTTTAPPLTSDPCPCDYQLLDNSNLDLISSQPQYSTVSGKVVTQPTAFLGSDTCSVSLSCPDGTYLLAMNMKGGGWYTTDTFEGTCNPSNSSWSFGISNFDSSLSFSNLTAACVNSCESGTTNTTLPPTTTTTAAPTVTCEEGWKLFQRPSGPWCIKVVAGEGTYAQAETSCASMGAVVSSFQNQDEVNYTLATGYEVMGVTGSLWVGATRTNICLGIGQTSQCTELSSFAWTDGSATGTDGFIWTSTQPDNAHVPRVQNCIMILSANVPSLIGVTNGQMDDVDCSIQYDTNNVVRKVRAWPCGKRP